MKSNEFLQAAIDVQKERGAQYDKPSGERSMGATVAAFNCITGFTLEESDGWMLLGLLKLVRQSQNTEKYHHDSALDFVAYASLYAEAASEQCKPAEDARKTGGVIKSDATYIFGESASEQCVPNNSIPSWARWIATDQDGEKYCYENMPEIDEEHTDDLFWFCNSGKEQFLGNVKKPFNARTTMLSLDKQ
jgi:hypothetical protein